MTRPRHPPPPPPPPGPLPGPPQLASIVVFDPSMLTPGAMGVPAATVNLTAAAIADTFVEATTANPAALTVAGQGVTVPAGMTSAAVVVDVLQGGASVEVSFTLGAQTLQATIVTG